VLSTTYATGANSWTIREFNVTPTQDIYAIAIGPNCQPAFTEDNPYYFLDNLLLADVREFEFVISGSGHPCASDFTLNLPKRDSLSYQWYRDGIAIPGAIDTSYQPVEEGVYQVRIIGPESCRVTKQYLHSLPKPSYETTKYLCEGERFAFNGQMLTQSGIYFDTLKTADQCDSIIRLELTKVRDTTVDLQAKIFAGEQFTVGPEVFEEPTTTEVVLSSKYGCDSIIRLDLSHYQVYIPNAFSPNGDGINDHFSVQGGDDLIGITSLRIFGRWGELCYEVENMDEEDLNVGWDGTVNGQPREGIHTYIMVLRMNDGLDHILHGSVLILR
jgi:gliding motility-associated-like protein